MTGWSVNRCWWMPSSGLSVARKDGAGLLSFGEQRQKLKNNFEYMILIPTFAR